MSEEQGSIPKMAFSEKYTPDHALYYFEKHQTGFRTINTWLEQRMAEKGLKLAGDPASILDVPCGAGRFWKTLTANPHRRLFAADNSFGMVHTAHNHQPKEFASRFHCFQGSAFLLPLPDNFVESVFCIRLVHHLGKPEERIALFKELHRVTSRTVLISLWVDGNYKAWRRALRDRKRDADPDEANRPYRNRHLIPRQVVEAEFRQVGLEPVHHVDMIPHYSMWRLYVLEKR